MAIPCWQYFKHFKWNYRKKCSLIFGLIFSEKHENQKRSHRSDDSKIDVKCPVCCKVLKKWYYQLYHKNTCSTNVVYKCDLCGQEGFVNNITLQNHIKSKHSTDRPFQCEHCDARYATSMALSTHRSRVHRVNKHGEPVEQKLFSCDYCGKLLTGTLLLSRKRARKTFLILKFTSFFVLNRSGENSRENNRWK